MNRGAGVAAVAVLFSGMFAGFLTTVLVLEGSLRGFGAQVYTQVRLVELEHLDDLATALLPPAILAAATVSLVGFRHCSRGRWLALTAVLLLLATLVISVSISLPINADQQNWSVLSPPDDWANVRDRWQLAHVARTGASVLAFVLLTATAMSPKVRPTSAAPSASSNSRRARPDPTATAGSR